jgi:hypothetical protein
VFFLRRPYKSLEEYYEAVRGLSGALRGSGCDGEAERLDMVMKTTCTTSSELLGELMRALSDIDRNCPAPLRRQVRDCHYFAKHYRRILGLR